jgi:RNA recognition motif-containing protein
MDSPPGLALIDSPAASQSTTPRTRSLSSSSHDWLQSPVESTEMPESRTTLHVRNLPCYFKRSTFCQLMDAQGLHGQYDFVYLPMDFTTKQSIGYAFVNFRNSTAAVLFRACMHGFNRWQVFSKKVCSVQWSSTQGFEQNLQLLRKSGVMNKPGVPEEYQPCVFENGRMMPFPYRGNRAERGMMKQEQQRQHQQNQRRRQNQLHQQQKPDADEPAYVLRRFNL